MTSWYMRSVGVSPTEPPLGPDYERHGVGVLLVGGATRVPPVAVIERLEIGLGEAILYPTGPSTVTYLGSASTVVVTQRVARPVRRALRTFTESLSER